MLWKIRVLFFYLIITIVTISFYFAVFSPAILLLHFSKRGGITERRIYEVRYKLAEVFSRLFIWVTKVFAGLGYEVEGLEKLPSTPSLALANHQSFWENMFVQLIVPKHSWVIKQELFDIPFFGWGLKEMDLIAIDRSQSSSVSQIINGGKKKLESDHWVVMFPEGTRLKVHQTVKFKPSAAKLAIEAKVPIVMIAHNAGLYWPKSFWLERPGIIKVKVVEVMSALEVQNFDSRSLTEHIEKVINTAKQELLTN